MTRREYLVRLIVNDRSIAKVVIDSHYELKHGGSVNDQVILELIQQLSDRSFEPESEKDGFQYFTSDLILGKNRFRLIWLLEMGEIYIGVVNAYRRRK